MTTLWKIDPILMPQVLLLQQYRWNKEGLVLWFKDIHENQIIRISFVVDLDGFRIIYLHDSVETNNQVWQLMQEANVPSGEPFVPAFIRDSSPFIDSIRAQNQYCGFETVKLFHFIVVTDDFRIDIVSNEQPKVSRQEDTGVLS